MPTIVESTEKRRDYADEEQRDRIDWGDDLAGQEPKEDETLQERKARKMAIMNKRKL